MPDPSPELDEQFMRRAIRLAMNGRGRVEPNPMVACVLVKDGRVIGEGYHAQFGGPHAEPTALANCTESAGATAYVTLEPCCHTNKKTPPCAPRLIDAKIARVVIGCLDPNPDVNGKGVAMLRAAGIQVDGPVLEGAAKQLIAPFLARVMQARPYVTLKWAQTADAKVAKPGGFPLRISNDVSTRLVHTLRSRSDAIIIGVRTAISDDPALTVRSVPTLRVPRRVVLDGQLKLSLESQLVRSAKQVPLTVYTTSDSTLLEKAAQLVERGVDVRRAESAPCGSLFLNEVLPADAATVLVEPGPTLADSFLRDWPQLVDRVWVIRSRNEVAQTAPLAAKIPESYFSTGELNLDGDTLTEYLNPDSPVFFAPEPSADFVLARDGVPTSSRP